MAVTPEMAQAASQQVGRLIQGFGSWQASMSKAANLKASAKVARREASAEAQMATDEAERAGARAAVAGAASGGGFEGSFGSVLEDLERTGVFNARSAIYAGNVDANNRLYESEVAKQEGRFALISSIFQTSASIAGQQMQAAEQRKQQVARKGLYQKGYGR